MKKLIAKAGFLILIGFYVIGFSGCDIIPAPYTEDIVAPPVTSRKVLLEDYTGHKCPNCPFAAKELDTIVNYLFPGRVIAIAAHVSDQFASPSPGLFYYDFRTVTGTVYDDYFEISQSGLPKGMVNREGFPTQTHKKNYTQWSSDVYLELQKEPEADITITTSYDSTSRTISATVKSKFLLDKQGEFYLSVLYIEDSIIQPQIIPGNQYIENYKFNHVLRGNLNGNWGEVIGINPAAFDESTKSYSTVIVADAVAAKCRVVAYIYNNTTKAVIQAEEAHF